MTDIVWTIAGSDSGGGAGIQTDLHTIHALGGYGCTVITALTAQNSKEVIRIELTSSEMMRAQLDALKSDLPANAIKIGMLGDISVMKEVAEFLEHYDGPVVIDPVMVSTSGAELFNNDAKDYFIEHIIPFATVLIPNLLEAQSLLNREIETEEEIEEAAKDLLKISGSRISALGAFRDDKQLSFPRKRESSIHKAVIIKGGHSKSNDAADYFTNKEESFWLSNPRFWHNNSHGSGCVLSSAIATCLAKGYEIKEAVVVAKIYVTQGLANAEKLGQGPGPVKHHPLPDQFYSSEESNPPSSGKQSHFLEQSNPPSLRKQFSFAEQSTPPSLRGRDKRPKQSRKLNTLPKLRKKNAPQETYHFPNCSNKPLGLYPVVDSTQWLERLLPLGVSTIQLRIKDKTCDDLENEIQNAVKISNQFNARLFINDYWELAIKHNAYGVHLGQDDLNSADMKRIQDAGLRLGISTHCYHELARAHYFNPSYIAFGPIYDTTSKKMPFDARGIAFLKTIRGHVDYPLVAIGGINLERFKHVKSCGVDGIAMISAITHSSDPEETTKQFLDLWNE